jgi:hypothetical protein
MFLNLQVDGIFPWIIIGFSRWATGAGSKFCSHDWCKRRHIVCYEKDKRSGGYPGQVRVHTFFFIVM